MGRAPCCDENGLKKGPWTPEEDQKLVDYIQKHGHGSWRALPKNAGLQRCGKSCRLRWTNYLRPDIKRGKFSFEEEQTILQLHAILGNKWSAIAARLPGRTDNEIKNYWNTHLKKRLLQMGIDPVTHRPRTDLFAPPHLSQYFASLSQMSHWENARLEAEARWLSNCLKLAAAYRSSGMINPENTNAALEGLNLLRSAGAVKLDDPSAAMGWGLNSNALEQQLLQVYRNGGADNSDMITGSSSATQLLDNVWPLSQGYPYPFLNPSSESSLTDETQMNQTSKELMSALYNTKAKVEENGERSSCNLLMQYSSNQGVPNPISDGELIWASEDHKAATLPALVSESCSPCTQTFKGGCASDSKNNSSGFEESCNNLHPDQILLDISENSKTGKQNPSLEMGSCSIVSHQQMWSDTHAEEEGKDYWTNVLKLIDPETLPTAIDHIIRP